MVALGCRTRLLSGRRTQSAFGYARLDLVLLYVRRRSTADHGNKSGSTYTEITEPSLTQSQPAARARRTLREGASAFTSASARYGVSNREEQNKSIARIGTRLHAVAQTGGHAERSRSGPTYRAILPVLWRHPK